MHEGYLRPGRGHLARFAGVNWQAGLDLRGLRIPNGLSGRGRPRSNAFMHTRWVTGHGVFFCEANRLQMRGKTYF